MRPDGNYSPIPVSVSLPLIGLACVEGIAASGCGDSGPPVCPPLSALHGEADTGDSRLGGFDSGIRRGWIDFSRGCDYIYTGK